MKLDKCFPGNWLKSSDLGEDDHTVTIESVESQMIGQGEQAKLKLVVKFEEFDRPLVVNLTNAKSIAKLWGDETDEWPGKRVTLWVNPAVTFGSEVVEAIRIRSKAPAGGKPALAQAQASNGLLKYTEAVALVAGVGINEADLKTHLKNAGFVSYNAVKCTPEIRALVAGLESVDAGQHDADDSDVPW